MPGLNSSADPGVNRGAGLIVSGDADLLASGPFHAIPIVTPARFLQCRER
jgi:predicted nucleic acid-binding protein